MKQIAYLILAHADPHHFGKLVTALGNKCDIYVHVDKSSDILPFRSIVQNDNVTFIDKRIRVSWAGISVIDALVELMKQAIQKKEKYTHLVMLSGSCYPIKRVDEIERIYLDNPHKEFIKFINMTESPEHYLRHIKKKWFKEPFLKSNGKFLRTIDKIIRRSLNIVGLKNKWDDKIIPYFGSTWCALSVNCCQYILEYQLNNPWFKVMNYFTFSPDEHYFHTIIGNSKFKNQSDGVQPYKGGGTWRLANFHIIDKSLAKWYAIDDWDEIKNSDKLFVRKIRTLDGLSLITRIDNDILNI